MQHILLLFSLSKGQHFNIEYETRAYFLRQTLKYFERACYESLVSSAEEERD